MPDSRASSADFDERFELLVVGGGALGCAAAYEAAKRGIRVALIEKGDFASGTSANSLRTVHGGLRYLQKLDLSRSRKSIRERRELLRLAPHLVAPQRFAIPLFPGLARGRLAAGIGLLLNDCLSWDRNRGLRQEATLPGSSLVGTSDLEAWAPGIDFRGATGGASWFDAVMINAERLSMSFAISAARAGAVVGNYLEADFSGGDALTGGTLTIRDKVRRESFPARTATIADCRGPWIGMSSPDDQPYVKGVNVVVRGPEISVAVGFAARNSAGQPVPGRLFFAIPGRSFTEVGTWYFSATANPDQLELNEMERETIVSDLRAACPGWNMDDSMIVGTRIGLQPAGGADLLPCDRPIINELAPRDSETRVWQAQAEKWTTARDVAESLVESMFPGRAAGRDVDFYGRVDSASSIPTTEDPEIRALLAPFGSNAGPIEQELLSGHHDGSSANIIKDAVVAATNHALHHEMPVTAADLAYRRLGLEKDWPVDPPSADAILRTMAVHFGWDENTARENSDLIGVSGSPGVV